MSQKILILNSDPVSTKTLHDYLVRHGNRVWRVSNTDRAREILVNESPGLVFLDIHLPEKSWLELVDWIRRVHPATQLIFTNKQPDIRLELLAKEQGGRIFLREPFTGEWIQRALGKLENDATGKSQPPVSSNALPAVRVPMRLKITLPYVLMALAFVLASGYMIGRYILETMQDRFNNQLIDAGRQAADWMVQEENHILETVRLIAHSGTIAESIEARDSEKLRGLILPVVINSQEEAVEILDSSGESLLSLHHSPGDSLESYEASKGDRTFLNTVFIQKALSGQSDEIGDKYAGLVNAPWGETFFIASPILSAAGKPVGAVLVGDSLDTLAHQMSRDVLAQITLYDTSGTPAASTLFLQQEIFPLSSDLAQIVLNRQNFESTTRSLRIAGKDYSEILGSWEARGGQDLGVIGISLAEAFFTRPKQVTSLQALLFIILAFIGVIGVGAVTARQITQPLSEVVQASVAVADGNFKVKVPLRGNDEIMVLAHAFNHMVAGLQEGSIYRDLLGRTVSPEVREALRQSFASGNLKLEGHNIVATVLMSDIRNFTSLSEKEVPATVLAWLNEYFGELVPVITRNGGVVDKFEGDAILAFFGILPTRLPPEESAYQACRAAVEMMDMIQNLNTRRTARGEPPLITGIGINTGDLTAGGLGTSDRLNYTIIGDTVNTTQRLEGLTRTFGETGAVASESTLAALHTRRDEFQFEPLGEQAFKGKSEVKWVYRLRPGNQNLALQNNGHKDQLQLEQASDERTGGDRENL